MATEAKKGLYNIREIGTPSNPVEIIHVRLIAGIENMSKDVPVYSGASTETFTGIEVNAATGKVTFKSNVENAVTFESTLTVNGAVDFDNTLNVDGISTFNAKINTRNIDMSIYYQSGDGGNHGLSFPGGDEDADFSGNVTIDGNLNDIDGFLKVQGYIDCDSSITADGNIRTNSVFKVSGDEGINDTIDFSTYAGVITIAGGIIINKS